MTRRELIAVLLLAALAGPAAAADKPEGKKGPAGASFLLIDGLKVSVNRGRGRRGVMSLECGLDVPDPVLRARVQSLLPRLRAAFLAALQVYASGLDPGELPDMDIISRELQRQTDMIVGKPGARLLLGSSVVN
jgi:hypothetical protein